MKTSRRNLLLGASTAVLLSTMTLLVDAQETAGPSTSDSGRLLTTMKLVNTSDGAVAENSTTCMFGHPFKKGDIPTGQYPIFKIGGTTCLYSIGAQRTWNDGSLKFASFMLQIPSSIASAGAATVSIYSGGSAPRSSSRTTADFTAGGLDLNVSLTVANLPGASPVAGELGQTYVARLSDCINNGIVHTFMDGPAGKVWVVEGDFKKVSVAQGTLRCRWYIAALQDARGGLYGIRYLARVCQPFYDVTSPVKGLRVFSSVTLMNGAALIRDLWATKNANGNPFTFQANVGFDYETLSAGDIKYGCRSGGQAAYLTTTGTLPSPLSTNTLYFISNGNGDTPHFHLNKNPHNAVSFNGLTISPIDTGTGTHTITLYPCLGAFQSFYSCGSKAMWDYVQGSGSIATETTLRFEMNNRYWKSTRVMPPYDLETIDAYGVHSTKGTDYTINGAGTDNGTDSWQAFGSAGEHPYIGIIPNWAVVHFISQAAADENAIRVLTMCWGQVSTCIKSSASRTLVVVNNADYTGHGLPVATPSLSWSPSNPGGFTYPVREGSPEITIFNGCDTDHLPGPTAYTYLFTGEPQFLDQLGEMGVNAVCTQATGTAVTTPVHMAWGRQKKVGTSTYYGVTVGNPAQIRTDAWATRDLAWMSGLCPDTHFENAHYKTYFNDMLTATYQCANAWIGTIAPGFGKTNGIYMPQSNIGSGGADEAGWELGYMIQVTALAASMAESSDALTLLSYVKKWPEAVHTYGGGGLANGYYYMNTRMTAANDGSYATGDFISSADAMNFDLGCQATWSSATNTVTITKVWNGMEGHYSPHNGDRVRYDTNVPLPAGVPSYTPLYMFNVSGMTFQLVTDPTYPASGSLVTITDTSTVSQVLHMAWIVNTQTGLEAAAAGWAGVGQPADPAGYSQNASGTMSYVNAVLGTVNPTILADLRQRSPTNQLTFSPSVFAPGGKIAVPKYMMATTF